MRGSGSRGSVLVALVITALSLSGTLVTASASASAAPTRTVKLSPVTASDTLKPGYKVVATHYGGTCEPGSDIMAGVYRCFSGNGVYDPCWAELMTRVGCLFEPWSHSVVRIQTTAALEFSPPGRFYIWGVQLTTGQRCVAAQGAHDRFHQHIVNYYCGNRLQLVLLDQPNEHRSQWTIREAYLHHHGYSYHYTYGPVATIAVAWYGLPSALPSTAPPTASTAQHCSEATAGSLTYDIWIDSGSPTYVSCTSAADVFAAYYSQYGTGPNGNVGVTADGAAWFCGTAGESLAPLLAVRYYPNSLNTLAQISAYPPGAVDPG
jgi:hypothetical protein